MSFLFKNFLSFEELADYLESQGYCYNLDNERDYNSLKSLIVDLNRERKLMPVFYYSGWGNVEVVKQKGLEVINSGEVYFRGYFGVVQMAEILRKLFKNGEPIDVKQYHCYHYSKDDIARLAIHGDDADESQNSTSLTTVEFETDKPSFFITFDDLRYPRTTFDSFFKINQIDERSQQLEEAQEKIAKLEKQLAQAKAKLADKPTDEDKELNTKSQNYAAKIVLAMAQIADLSLDSPYASKEPNTTNSIIFDQIKTNGMKVSNQVIGNWLKLATEQSKDD